MGEHSSGQQAIELADLPDSLLLEIFFHLSAEDLASLARSCSRLNRITSDELLWKRVFQRRFKVPRSVPIRPGATSWRSEYQRLRDETPAVLCEELTKHRDQVLHVSFSHRGDMFATCSKDAKILVWNSSSPSTLRFSANMTEKFNWRYSQFSQFNKSDTLLLVSGVFHGNMTTSGEIAVFDMKEFQVQCRVTNKPYDVFGCWYDNQHLFSGSLYWTGQLQSTSALWLNRASQQVESEKESVMMNLYRFSNVNASSIRTVMVADVPQLDPNHAPSSEDVSARDTLVEMGEDLSVTVSQNGDCFSDCEDKNTNNNCADARPGCSKEDRMESDDDFHTDCYGALDLSRDQCRQRTGSALISASQDRKVSFNQTVGTDRFGQQSGDQADKAQTNYAWYCGSGSRNVQVCVRGSKTDVSSSPAKACYPFTYCCKEGENKAACSGSEHELEALDARGPLDFSCDDSDSSSSSFFSPHVLSFTSSPSLDTPSTDLHSPPQRHRSHIPRMAAHRPNHRTTAMPLPTEKLLIFTMGDETYTPHLVGFKRIELKHIVGEEEAARRMREGEEEEDGALLPNVEHNLQGTNLPPTQVDHTINLKGHIVGMALSPDHRYLYVNSRQWPENYHIESVLEPPPIAQEIDIHIIDLVTWQEVGKVMSSHKAFTPNDECFFLFLNVSDLYVASGAEDRRGYLWDRYYGIHLHCFPHNDVVNSVAFNPWDQDMLITASDDNTVKVWRSRRQMRALQQQRRQLEPKEC